MDVEMWGRCSTCDRWFYCEGWFDKDVPAPTCPVCGAEPSAIENRAARGDIVIDEDTSSSNAAGMA